MRGERAWRPQLTGQEQRLGWVFFALYLFLFPFLLPGVRQLLDAAFEVYFTDSAAIAAYYGVILALLVAAFWDFLRHAARLLVDWLPENLFAIATGLVGALLLGWLVGLIPLPVVDPSVEDYRSQYLLGPGSTVAAVVFLRPAVEEILYRGLLFGSLRKRSRLLAYGVSALLFALGSVWQFAFPTGGPAYLLLFLQYLPLGVALCWSYDNGGSVFAPMVLRMLTSAVALGTAVHG